MRTDKDVEAYLLRLNRRFQQVDAGAATFLVQTSPGMPTIAIRVDPPLVVVRVHVGDVEKGGSPLELFRALVELNAIYHSTSIDFNNPNTLDLFSFGSFETSGNLVNLSVGANAVIVPERLELGAAYTTPISSQRNFDFSGVIVKMVIRY